METATILRGFFSAIEKDPRISVSHIGLYVTLVSLCQSQGETGCLEIFGKDVMLASKISSTATYIKLLHELIDFRYLHYEPSYYKRKASRISIAGIQDHVQPYLNHYAN
ncbi:hypothetical protein [Dyadobacter psychrotolerans]|uniref:DUF4373 domain-containing protein n=1 Tax=Dyadobacter psychrotolerans TaxID=2541721 RepID=A0A4R5DUE2_9BACT|nr:hypothetical protein [Dyadobacter psychrotolerans]TDE18079.1 hypothetical protein E0F88_00570 [Dyadobacter psychrotolerans]